MRGRRPRNSLRGLRVQMRQRPMAAHIMAGTAVREPVLKMIVAPVERSAVTAVAMITGANSLSFSLRRSFFARRMRLTIR